MRLKIIRIIQKIFEINNVQIQKIYPRPMCRFIRDNLKGELVGAEVGVFEGEHAETLCENLKLKKLYLIDPYESYEGYKDGDEVYGKILAALPDARDTMRITLNQFDDIDRVEMHPRDINEIPNGSLDFVYIDADHYYEGVKKDLAVYYPKLKVGGIFGGHDYDNGICDVHDGVVKAVTEFINEKKLKLYVGHPDWWVVKE